MATHSSILVWEIPWTEGAWQTTVYGVAKEWDTTKQTNKKINQVNNDQVTAVRETP